MPEFLFPAPYWNECGAVLVQYGAGISISRGGAYCNLISVPMRCRIVGIWRRICEVRSCIQIPQYSAVLVKYGRRRIPQHGAGLLNPAPDSGFDKYGAVLNQYGATLIPIRRHIGPMLSLIHI